MALGKLEHVNLTVSDIHRSAHLLTALCGWKKRWQGPSLNGGETIHLGDESTYIAFYNDGREHAGQRKGRPLNHVGLLVDNLEDAENTVRAHGLKPFGHDNYEPGRRFYFFDWNGIEFELINYNEMPDQNASS